MPRLATISSARAGASAPVFYQGPELPTASTSVYLRALALRRLPAWRTSGDGALLARVEAKLHQLLEFYAVENADEVRRFLRVYPDAPDVLLEARPYIEKIFGPTTQVVLEVTFDPDSESHRDSVELFGNIQTSLSVEEALERLNQFDSEWFLAQLARAGGRLNFNLAFV
ncbi:MAG: hypothetical protein CVU38_17310 [Chloroflexi bacterium HGW-Chloroflexi-1]|nr:MAG: hypothetical protein CVU38_17310 [Chloroflexi bacterium HGW-Chloroflexi-1]